MRDKAHSASEFANAVDPHFWFDPEMWSSALSQAMDSLYVVYPTHKAQWQQNFSNYQSRIDEANELVKKAIASIPLDQRVLVTSHDAFNYFGRSFGVEVKALQGISTLSEAGIKDVTNLVDFIIQNEVKCIFVESSVSQKSLKSVKENCEAQNYALAIGEELFSDAMGEQGTFEGTYPGMLITNAQRIQKGILSHD